MLTNKEKEQIEALIASVINDSVHYGNYEQIANAGYSFNSEHLKYLESKVQKSAHKLAEYIETLIDSKK